MILFAFLQGGVQSLEAMLYTIDWINNQEIIPGVKVGAYILDDCDKDTYGLEQAVDFIKGKILKSNVYTTSKFVVASQLKIAIMRSCYNL